MHAYEDRARPRGLLDRSRRSRQSHRRGGQGALRRDSSRTSRPRRRCTPATSWSRPRTRRRRSSPSSTAAPISPRSPSSKSIDPAAPERRRSRLLRPRARWCRSSPTPPSRCKRARSPRRRCKTQFGWHVIKVEDAPRRKRADLRGGAHADRAELIPGDGRAPSSTSCARPPRSRSSTSTARRQPRHRRSSARRPRRRASGDPAEPNDRRIRGGRTPQGADATPRSPLAPAQLSRAAADRRRAPGAPRGWACATGPDRRAAGRARPGHRGRRRLHPLADRRRRRSSWCRARPRRRQGARRSWSIPATPMSSPARPATRAVRAHGRGRGASCSAATPSEVFVASTGVIGEPLPAEKHRRRRCRADAGLRRRWLGGGRRGDHDHRHLSQGRRRATARIGGVDGAHQRHRQGLGHDRARHGDDAGLRLHRRQRCRPPVLQALLRAGRRPLASTASRSTATPRPATRVLLFATGQAQRIRPIAERRRSAPRRFPRARSRRVLLDLALPGRARRRGRAEARHASTSTGAATDRRRAAHRRSRSPTRRWSRPRSPARTPTGAASSWRSARPARRPTATGCRSPSAASPIAARRRRGAGLRRGAGRRAHEGPRDRHRRRCRRRPRPAPRCGPAT